MIAKTYYYPQLLHQEIKEDRKEKAVVNWKDLQGNTIIKT